MMKSHKKQKKSNQMSFEDAFMKGVGFVFWTALLCVALFFAIAFIIFLFLSLR